ncbi:MAG: tetratricopeptide repeat protein [Elusimicrobiota bacterium]
MKSNRRAAALALFLAAAAYLPRLSAPFMWDDRPFIVNVAAFDRPIPLAAYFSPSYFGLTGELTWRPLATLSYAVGTRVFGRRPLPLRLTMFALHLLNCLLLGLLVASAGLGSGVGLAAAALFLIHPAHVETVMTVTFNKEILATLGILAMLLAHRRGRPWLAAAAFAFALLPKETGVLGLPLALMLDFSTGGRGELERRWKDYSLYSAVAAIYLYFRFGPMKGPGGEANLSAALPWSERLYYAAHGFASSVRVLFFPWRLRIEYFALPAASLYEYAFRLAAAASILVFVVALARRSWKKEPALSFFLLWPLPVLFLTSNVFPTAVLSLRLMSERWLYLPAAGFAVAVAYALRKRPIALNCVVIFWGALLFVRLQDWRSETRLWQSLVDIYPWSAKANEGLGEALFRAGRAPEAEAAFRKGLALRASREDLVLAHYVPVAPPGTIAWESAPLYRELALCRLRLNDDRGAEDFFIKAAALQPGDVFSRRALAYLFARGGDFVSARTWLEQGLALDARDGFLLRLEPDIERRRLTFQARFD